MSLSEDERGELERFRRSRRRELERLRRSNRRRRTLDDAGTRALMLTLFFWWIFPWLANTFGVSLPDHLFWQTSYIVGIPVCFVLGFLSCYYGSFKMKKEAEG